jgi:RNA polymerase sigma-70 factor (ECF subfamily)
MGTKPNSPPPGGEVGEGVQKTPRASLSRSTLEGVQRRDPAALAELFDMYFGRIFNLAYRMTGKRTTAEDITQDVFLRVYKAAHRIDVSRDPGPWLITIATNLCRERWRSARERFDRDLRSLDAEPELMAVMSADTTDPEMEMVQLNRDEKIMEAISKLAPPLRTVVVLHDFQGLSHEEIAPVVGARPAAVRKRYSRALARLRLYLQDVLK